MNSYLKGSLITGLLILGIYYGLLPLLGFEVWVRNDGWNKFNIGSALTNTAL